MQAGEEQLFDGFDFLWQQCGLGGKEQAEGAEIPCRESGDDEDGGSRSEQLVSSSCSFAKILVIVRLDEKKSGRKMDNLAIIRYICTQKPLNSPI